MLMVSFGGFCPKVRGVVNESKTLPNNGFSKKMKLL